MQMRLFNQTRELKLYDTDSDVGESSLLDH